MNRIPNAIRRGTGWRRWSILLVVLVLTGAGLYSYPSKTLARRCERLLSSRLKGSVTVSHARVRPLLGVRCYQVEGMVIPGGRQIWFESRVLKINYRPLGLALALLRGESPFVAIPPGGGSQKDIRKLFSGVFRRVVIRGMVCRVSCDAFGEWIARGLEADVRMPPGRSVRAEGRCRVTAVSLDTTRYADDIDFRLDLRDSLLVLRRIRAASFGGRVTGMVELLPLAGKVQKVTVQGKGIDCSDAYTALFPHKGSISGTAEGRLSLVPGMRELQGQGRITISNVRARDIPLQKTFTLAFFLPGLDDIFFSELQADVRIDSGKVFTPLIRGKGEPLEFVSAGYVRMDGYMHQSLHGILSRKFLEEVSPVVRRSLYEEKKGRRSFRCIVRGSYAHPRVEIERQLYKRSVRQAFDSMKDEVDRLFR